MRLIQSTRDIKVPEDVTVVIKNRIATVTGPRGELKRDLSHARLDLKVLKNGRLVRAELWFGNRKALATIRTITAHIENMIVGVTKGFEYKMRMVYAHFPINVSCEDGGSRVEIRNFLGEKIVRHVKMLEGVKIVKGEDVKDQLILTGNDIDLVSQSAANIQQKCRVKNKDIRKFLDGIYVSAKGNIVTE